MEYNDNDIVRFESGIIDCRDTIHKKKLDLKFRGTCCSKYENKDELSKLIVKEGIEVVNKSIEYSKGDYSFLQIHYESIAKNISDNVKTKYNIEVERLSIMFDSVNMEDLPNEIVYKFCPNCGIKVQVGKFCPNCGVKVGE